MTLQDFAVYSPGSSQTLFLYDDNGSTYTIRAASIHTTACNSLNALQALQAAERITFTINGVDYSADINVKINKGQYFVVDFITTFDIPATGATACSKIVFEPGVGGIDFDNSDYNPQFNNYNDNRKFTGGINSGKVYDVDRSKSQTKPLNLTAILEGTAKEAQFQELNYTSVGILNSRYVGAKTSETDFGIKAFFNGSLFKGEEFASDITGSIICSKSIDEREIEDFFFSVDPTFGSITGSLEPSIRFEDLGVVKLKGAITDVATTITIPKLSDSSSIFPEDRLELHETGSSLAYERIKVINVAEASNTALTLTVIRGYESEKDPEGVSGGVAYSLDDVVRVRRIKGDTIYRLAGNKPDYRLAEKNIYVKDPEKVYYIDTDGRVYWELLDCTL